MPIRAQTIASLRAQNIDLAFRQLATLANQRERLRKTDASASLDGNASLTISYFKDEQLGLHAFMRRRYGFDTGKN
jgi:ABC-type phosphate transport system auxiliary subunit